MPSLGPVTDMLKKVNSVGKPVHDFVIDLPVIGRVGSMLKGVGDIPLGMVGAGGGLLSILLGAYAISWVLDMVGVM